ncbi:MAG: riboflavin biosynthesis protein RibF [Ruminococcaceae bacterium]|nr:riboflavin biosynthesis protein RibF [Oscillospiraceae bacterium]
MRVFNRRIVPEDGIKPTAVALGFFDGVHIGHQAVISAARDAAVAAGWQPAVFTFTQPSGQSTKGRQIITLDQKNHVLAELGVQYCFEPPFESFSALSPEAFFAEMLMGEYRAKALFCGENYGFGAKRAGNVQRLRELCYANGIHLNVVPTTLYQGLAVSSSRIRQALAAGDMPAAAAMLGRPYAIDYPVRHGRQIGSKLGFPTLNQTFPPEVQPPAFGVYITQAVVDGKAWPSATGYGTRPTVDDGAPTCETFIPGFEGDLYGRPVQVRFYKKIADPTRFENLEALAEAVQSWARQAQGFFETAGV